MYTAHYPRKHINTVDTLIHQRTAAVVFPGCNLGRGTASCMDQFVVVIEPGARSIQTYTRIKSLARDIGITRVRVVANKIRDDSDREFIRSRIPEEDLLGFISYNPEVIEADRKGLSPYDCSPSALEEIRIIKAKLDEK